MNASSRPAARSTQPSAYAAPGPPAACVPPLHRRLLLIATIGAHAAVLLGALAVPAYALTAAVLTTLQGSGAGHAGPVVVLNRWSVLLANTAVVCGMALLTALPIGLLVGISLARTNMLGRVLFATLAVLGACLPIYTSVVFIFACVPASMLTGSAVACGVLYGLLYCPLAIVILGATFHCADGELEDAARLDASPRAVLARVTIPQATWGIATLGILILLLVGTDFTITDVLSVRTFAEEVYTQFELHRSAAGPVLTSVPLLLMLAGLLVALQARYRLLGEHSPWQLAAPPRTISLGRWRSLPGVIGGILLLGLVGSPLAAVLARVVQSFDSLGALVRAAGTLWRDLLVSTVFAGIGATIVVLAGVGLAWVLLRAARLRFVIAGAVVLLLALPAPVVGITLTALLNQPGPLGTLYDSPIVIAIGYVVRFLPLGVLLLVVAVQRVPREIESAARLDGCDWLAVQRHVYWPAVAVDAVIVWLVILILAFAEIGATKMVVPPGWSTAAVRAFSLLHYGVYGDLAVLALLSVTIIFLLWLALVRLLRRRLAQPLSAA